MGRRKAISSLIAYVLVTLIGVTTLLVVLSALGPTFDTARSTSVISDALQSIGKIDTAIRDVASEAEGSKRTITVSAPDGTYGINTTYDWLYFDYHPNNKIALGGTAGNVYVKQGLEFADFFNWYANPSASPVWTNTSGQWNVSSSSYVGQNGLAYHFVGGSLQNWKFGATISNVSGTTGGEVFALPTTPESLVVFWTFDQTDNTTSVMDYSGNGNYGIWTNGTNVTGGKVGNSYAGYWPNPKGYVQNSSLKYKGQSFTANSLNNFTISAWIYPANTASREQHIAEFGSSQFYIWNSKLGTSSTFKSTGVTALTPNAWNHVVITGNNADGNVSLYLNGRLDNSTVGNTINIPTTIFEVGDLFTYSGNYNFNGTIDEVMAFNRTLSGDEVYALYETSAKKLLATGTQIITSKASPYIVLSNPAGQTNFDDVIVTQNSNDIRLIVPYNGIDINGTLRIGAGQHRVTILNGGVNSATGRTLLQINGV